MNNMNLGDNNLVGMPCNYERTVNSGAGGDTQCNLVIPTGEIWIVKFLTAYHNDATGARILFWYLRDTPRAIDIMGPYLSCAANDRFPFPFPTYVPGPFACSPGCFNVGILAAGLAANKNITLQAHVHKIYGVAPLG